MKNSNCMCIFSCILVTQVQSDLAPKVMKLSQLSMIFKMLINIKIESNEVSCSTEHEIHPAHKYQNNNIMD